jgi:hypothetical protein
VDIRAVQKLAWENKLAKGFNTTDVPLEFCLLSGELAEAFDAWRKGRQDVAEELADGRDDRCGLAGGGRGQARRKRGEGIPAPAKWGPGEGCSGRTAISAPAEVMLMAEWCQW